MSFQDCHNFVVHEFIYKPLDRIKEYFNGKKFHKFKHAKIALIKVVCNMTILE